MVLCREPVTVYCKTARMESYRQSAASKQSEKSYLKPARHQEIFMSAMQVRTPGMLTATLTLLALVCAWSPVVPGAGAGAPQEFTLILADHRFSPDRIEVQAGRPVILTLVNEDSITPHNIILLDKGAGLDIDTDVPARTSATIEFTPVAAGTYTFYCDKKLPFLKSHREQGMEGTLIVRDAE
jgi:plastocyanin